MKSNTKIAAAVVASFGLGVGAVSVLHAQAKPPAYVVAEIDVKDQDGYTKEFLPKAQATIKEMGGKYLGGAANKAISLAGAKPPNRVVLLQFPDMDAVKAFYDKQGPLEKDVGDKYASFRAIGIEGVEQAKWKAAGCASGPPLVASLIVICGGAESRSGTNLTSSDISYSVAIGGKTGYGAGCPIRSRSARAEPPAAWSVPKNCLRSGCDHRGRSAMDRRRFITLAGGAAAWPLVVSAQQAAKLPTIGYMAPSSEAADRPRRAAFVRRLGELGWVEGSNVRIEYRWADGVVEHAIEIAPELVRLKVDLIATSGDAYVIAAKKATATIPIVFASAGDPVGNGMVESLARPGGNATGLSIQLTETVGKRLGLLREVVPALARLSILFNAADSQVNLERDAAQAEAHALGLDVIACGIRPGEDFAPAIEPLRGRADALYVCLDPFVITNAARINSLALAARLPVMHGIRQNALAEGLMSYGPDFPDMSRRAAEIIDKILRGTKPADIPVEQPTKFDLVINLNTAKALGLDVPPTLLRPRRRCDRVTAVWLRCMSPLSALFGSAATSRQEVSV